MGEDGIIKLPPKKTWTPSVYQEAIFSDVASDRDGHLIVEARAGSGKTHSLVEMFKYVPKGKSIIAFAFNKSIQKELEERAPSYVLAKTFHSWGLQTITQNLGKVVIDNNSTFDRIKTLVEDDTDYNLISNIADTVAYCQYGLQDTPKQIEELIYRFGVDLCDLDVNEFISIVIKTLGLCKADTSKIDFNGMCWLPFIHNLSFKRFDIVAIDEHQDLNKSQLIMAKRTVKPNGRIIAYGDPFQSLYSWRLSDTTVMDELRSMPTTKTLSLPISYRCPKKVIALAQRWVPDIVCPDHTIDGEINEISLNELYSKAKPGCFILSRTNAPMIKIAMTFIRQGIPCNITGRDVGRGLTSLIKRSKKKRMDAFLTWLEKWKDDEIKLLIAKNISTENTLDKYECMTNLCEEHKTLEEVLKRIGEMFDDKDGKQIVRLSTVHRAKGKQTDDVFILRWTYRLWLDESISLLEKPNEGANIAYVACTRVVKRLFIVHKN